MGRQARAPGRAIRRNGTEQHPSELGYGRRRIRATRGDAVDHSRLRGIRPVREHERSSLRPRRGRRRRVVVSRLRGHERGLAETGLWGLFCGVQAVRSVVVGSPHKKNTHSILSAALLGVALHACLDFPFRVPFLALLCAAGVALWVCGMPLRAPTSGLRMRWLLWGVALLQLPMAAWQGRAMVEAHALGQMATDREAAVEPPVEPPPPRGRSSPPAPEAPRGNASSASSSSLVRLAPIARVTETRVRYSNASGRTCRRTLCWSGGSRAMMMSSNCRNELVRTTTASDLPMKLKPSHFQDVSMKCSFDRQF